MIVSGFDGRHIHIKSFLEFMSSETGCNLISDICL